MSVGNKVLTYAKILINFKTKYISLVLKLKFKVKNYKLNFFMSFSRQVKLYYFSIEKPISFVLANILSYKNI